MKCGNNIFVLTLSSVENLSEMACKAPLHSDSLETSRILDSMLVLL